MPGRRLSGGWRHAIGVRPGTCSDCRPGTGAGFGTGPGRRSPRLRGARLHRTMSPRFPVGMGVRQAIGGERGRRMRPGSSRRRGSGKGSGRSARIASRAITKARLVVETSATCEQTRQSSEPSSDRSDRSSWCVECSWSQGESRCKPGPARSKIPARIAEPQVSTRRSDRSTRAVPGGIRRVDHVGGSPARGPGSIGDARSRHH